MKITFDCLGFSTATVFVEKDGRQHQIGFVTDSCDELHFLYFGLYERYISESELPTAEAVIAEYRDQYSVRGVSINESIQYAS